MKKSFLILSLLVLLFPAACSVFAETPADVAEYVEGEALVVLQGTKLGKEMSVSAAYETSLKAAGDRVAKSVGATAVRTLSALAASTGKNIVHIRASDKTTTQLLQELKSHPDVLSASPNYKTRMLVTPNDEYFNLMWGMNIIGGPNAWDISRGSRSVFVAVIDTGIKHDHVDLAANMGRDLDGNYGIDYINYDVDPMDDQGHGTHVAGTIGAVGNNDIGVAGVNWTVSLLGVKVLNADGSGTVAATIYGLDYVVSQKRRGLNIRVVNMSLGGWQTTITNPEADPYGIACKAVSDEGMLLVVAAGNEYQDIDNPGGPGSDPNHPLVDYRGKRPYPASFTFDNMITVGAIDEDTTLADFSNYSPNFVHLGAPGVTIASTGIEIYYGYIFDSYLYMSGTSQATPHVAGAAALLAAAYPNETASQIKARLLNTVWSNSYLNGKVATAGDLDLDAAIRASAPGTVDGAWVIAATTNVYKYEGPTTGGTWTWTPARAKYITAVNENTCWISEASSDTLYKFSNGNWEWTPAVAKWVTAYTENDLWLVEARSDTLYRFEGGNFIWTPAKAKVISAPNDRVLWLVEKSSGYVYKHTPGTGTWEWTPGTALSLSAATEDIVWVISLEGNWLYKYDHRTGDWTWHNVKASAVSAVSETEAWFVDMDGRLCIFKDSAVTVVGGACADVSVYPAPAIQGTSASAGLSNSGSGDQDSGKGTGCDASGTLSPAALLLAIPLLLIAFKRTAK